MAEEPRRAGTSPVTALPGLGYQKELQMLRGETAQHPYFPSTGQRLYRRLVALFGHHDVRRRWHPIALVAADLLIKIEVQAVLHLSPYIKHRQRHRRRA